MSSAGQVETRGATGAPHIVALPAYHSQCALQPLLHLIFAQHFEQMIQAWPRDFASASQARRMREHAGFTLETRDQNPCGCQSKSTSKHRVQIFAQLPDSRVSHALTKNEDQNATAPVGATGEPGFVETFCKP